MPPLRYSINLTLDGCVDHLAASTDEELHRHSTKIIARSDALLFGRVMYEMMEAAFRAPVQTGVRSDWMEPFARTIDAAKKYRSFSRTNVRDTMGKMKVDFEFCSLEKD